MEPIKDAMNIKQNLQALRDQVNLMPNINLDAYQCGSAFCILGTAATMPQFQAMGLCLHEECLYLHHDRMDYMDFRLHAIFGELVKKGLFAGYSDGPEYQIAAFPYFCSNCSDSETGHIVVDEDNDWINHKDLALARLDFAISLEP